MSKKIIGHKSKKIAEDLARLDIAIEPGDIFINDRGEFYKVVDFLYEPHYPQAKDAKPETLVVLEYEFGRTRATINEFMPDSRFKRKYLRIEGPIEEAEKQAWAAMQEPQKLAPADSKKTESETTALAVNSQEAHLRLYQQQFQLAFDRAERVRRIMERKREQLAFIASTWQGRLSYLNQVLSMVEAYMGVYEEITLIRDGQSASAETPIHFIQAISYMDEEVGDVELRMAGEIGVQFDSIEVFDRWLVRDGHWKNIVPYEKCVAAMKVTRQHRDYGGDVFLARMARLEHNKIYFIIRNGEKIFRIHTGLSYGDKLFPEQEEMLELMQELDEAQWERKRLEIKKRQIEWQKRVAFLQGLIDRTSVFQPHTPGLNLFAEDDYDAGRLILIRNAENVRLPDGRLPYKEWHKKLNGTIKRGSRVIITNLEAKWHPDTGTGKSFWISRFGGNFWRSHPPLPKPGIYSVEDVEERKDYSGKPTRYFKILYNPGDTIYDGWWERGQRKNRVGFWLREDDWFMLHYDVMSLDDVSFYIGRRIERRNYREILPLLYEVYRTRKEELAEEADFVKGFLLVEGNRLETGKGGNVEFNEDDLWEAVDWWKTKNLWQRAIQDDERKAWRMIRNRIVRQYKERQGD